jgi:hypothetical protein
LRSLGDQLGLGSIKEKSVKVIEAQAAVLNRDDPKTQWKKPKVARLVAAGAEAGDNFSGEGGGSFS